MRTYQRGEVFLATFVVVILVLGGAWWSATTISSLNKKQGELESALKTATDANTVLTKEAETLKALKTANQDTILARDKQIKDLEKKLRDAQGKLPAVIGKDKGPVTTLDHETKSQQRIKVLWSVVCGDAAIPDCQGEAK